MKRLLILVLVPSLAFAQPEIDPAPEIDPPPTLPGESEPGYEPREDGDRIDGDLNQQNSNNGNITKTYNGAGSGRQMPASTAISPSLMSSGQQSCLKSMSGGVQLVGFGVSSGKYVQDPECNRRLNAITLSNMGMKVASVSLMCQNAQVWRAMFMSATPCPIIRGGRLLVGKTALLEVSLTLRCGFQTITTIRSFTTHYYLGVAVMRMTVLMSAVLAIASAPLYATEIDDLVRHLAKHT